MSTLDFRVSDNELTVLIELIVADDKLECEEVDKEGLEGDFLCKQTPPSAHKNPVMFAHSLICSYNREKTFIANF